MIEEQRNNPLHGIKLEFLLTELVDHYGWEVLADVMNFNCFKSNPGIKSSLKFLRKTPWAREKLEGFYLYKFKRLPKPSDEQYELPPRDRIIPLDQKPRSSAEITIAKPDASQKPSIYGKPKPDTSEKTSIYNKPKTETSEKPSIYDKSKPDVEEGSDSSSEQPVDVWAHWRK